jgi:hypothetical protein
MNDAARPFTLSRPDFASIIATPRDDWLRASLRPGAPYHARSGARRYSWAARTVSADAAYCTMGPHACIAGFAWGCAIDRSSRSQVSARLTEQRRSRDSSTLPTRTQTPWTVARRAQRACTGGPITGSRPNSTSTPRLASPARWPRSHVYESGLSIASTSSSRTELLPAQSWSGQCPRFLSWSCRRAATVKECHKRTRARRHRVGDGLFSVLLKACLRKTPDTALYFGRPVLPISLLRNRTADQCHWSLSGIFEAHVQGCQCSQAL